MHDAVSGRVVEGNADAGDDGDGGGYAALLGQLRHLYIIVFDPYTQERQLGKDYAGNMVYSSTGLA